MRGSLTSFDISVSNWYFLSAVRLSLLVEASISCLVIIAIPSYSIVYLEAMDDDHILNSSYFFETYLLQVGEGGSW